MSNEIVLLDNNSYTRDELLYYYESPLSLMRPKKFETLLKDSPEIIRPPPQALITAADAQARLENIASNPGSNYEK
ncbi:unnamed protein product [Caenorhabditis angaria]|uniref:Uncharacterized protein n=1 Tax=Caenorhabditis angaria TaxID=860376 RepID=A0A9P1IQV7_9PELO|nr:unnamed protein product [Caenorhabditis angaria]